MKRYSGILFIWIFCLLSCLLISYITYTEGDLIVFLAWITSSLFLTNLIAYHFYVTRPTKEKDDVLDL